MEIHRAGSQGAALQLHWENFIKCRVSLSLCTKSSFSSSLLWVLLIHFCSASTPLLSFYYGITSDAVTLRNALYLRQREVSVYHDQGGGKIVSGEVKHLLWETFKDLYVCFLFVVVLYFFSSQSKYWFSFEIFIVSMIFVFLHFLTLNWFGKFQCLFTSRIFRALPAPFSFCMLSDVGENPNSSILFH